MYVRRYVPIYRKYVDFALRSKVAHIKRVSIHGTWRLNLSIKGNGKSMGKTDAAGSGRGPRESPVLRKFTVAISDGYVNSVSSRK